VSKILLLSAYEAESHRYWREGLIRAFPEFDFHSLVLPARHFQWRIRGSAMYWSEEMSATLGQDFDLVLATSMVDLAVLRGLNPKLSHVPNILYFHENQLDFPMSELARGRRLEPAMVNIYSALAADRVIFNSCYNRDTFIKGLEGLLGKFPDYVPLSVIQNVIGKSDVIPVPLDDAVFEQSLMINKLSGHVVWNHRWEFDKGPELLLEIVRLLPAHLKLKFSIIGQQFRQQPEAFQKLKVILEERNWLLNWGYIEKRSKYLELVSSAQLVLSTALHEYQGLALIEACALGCTPVVPDRLAYREYIPDRLRYVESGGEALAAAELIQNLLTSEHQSSVDVSAYAWANLKAEYEALIKA
jgi:glycosyltransferase involved in cell wall biosynthesis